MVTPALPSRASAPSGSNTTRKVQCKVLFHINDAMSVKPGGIVPIEGYDREEALLAQCLGRPAAARLVAAVGAAAAIRLSAPELVAIGEVPATAAARFVAARGIAHSVLLRRPALHTSDRVRAALPPELPFADVEMLFAVALDARFSVKVVLMIAKGGSAEAVVRPRDLFVPLVRVGAHCFVIAHNHPGGEAIPSDADVVLTNRVAKAGRLLGINLIDHLIVAAREVFSFHEHNLLPTEEELDAVDGEAGPFRGGAS